MDFFLFFNANPLIRVMIKRVSNYDILIFFGSKIKDLEPQKNLFDFLKYMLKIKGDPFNCIFTQDFICIFRHSFCRSEIKILPKNVALFVVNYKLF